ncbi:hypothetical protein M2454_001497 [Aequitasia blattaphilus]|uniref:Uncharacterized protein n=1 Tax=Aequitasia blattaphilus TaxID=2949332 RepID=A0ABT1E758_9FIRM|nr:CFI-box-CTERM domain-containing protein [Aequitasia blattaphilus]MCP1101668.1 hypothetical protein [Aequitasia blattaphilus]MCR8614308.1 hypothetical protein [Aequitasia blattaphilus]
MEIIKTTLKEFFDENLGEIGNFKKKSYDDAFKGMMEKYRPKLIAFNSYFEELPEEEREAAIEEISLVIPEYAYEKINRETKRKKDSLAIDYNMTMAVYVIPGIFQLENPYWNQVAKKTVEEWNKKEVTSLNLSESRYETITSGFKKKLCFITTAVCDSMNKPDDCYELSTLRQYRDSYLMNFEEGKALVEEYYDIAPILVYIMNMQTNSSLIYEKIYQDYLLKCLKEIEENKFSDCEDTYKTMVLDLKSRYLPS